MRKFSARTKVHYSRKNFIWQILAIGLILLVCFLWVFRQIQLSKFLNNNYRVNLAIDAKNPIVISFAKNTEDKHLIIVFPQNLNLIAPYGYGNYRAESLWKLGVLEKKPQLFKETLADALGMPINFYIHKPELPEFYETSKVSDLISFLQKHFLYSAWFFSNSDFNVNLIDRFLICQKIWSLRSNDVLLYNLQDVPYLISDVILPDNATVKEFNFEILDGFLKQKFEDNLIRSQGLSIEIKNQTAISKIGQKFGRYLTNIGAKVINITNDSEQITGCMVFIDEQNKNKQIVRFLKNYFDCQVNKNQENQGVDILIKLGDSFGKRWSN